jgi:hypothetical protein
MYKLLRKVFVSKKEDVTVEGKMLHNKKLHDLYFPSKIEMGGACDMCGGGEEELNTGIWWVNLKRSLGRIRSRRKDNIKMDL